MPEIFKEEIQVFMHIGALCGFKNIVVQCERRKNLKQWNFSKIPPLV